MQPKLRADLAALLQLVSAQQETVSNIVQSITTVTQRLDVAERAIDVLEQTVRTLTASHDELVDGDLQEQIDTLLDKASPTKTDCVVQPLVDGLHSRIQREVAKHGRDGITLSTLRRAVRVSEHHVRQAVGDMVAEGKLKKSKRGRVFLSFYKPEPPGPPLSVEKAYQAVKQLQFIAVTATDVSRMVRAKGVKVGWHAFNVALQKLVNEKEVMVIKTARFPKYTKK